MSRFVRRDAVLVHSTDPAANPAQSAEAEGVESPQTEVHFEVFHLLAQYGGRDGTIVYFCVEAPHLNAARQIVRLAYLEVFNADPRSEIGIRRFDPSSLDDETPVFHFGHRYEYVWDQKDWHGMPVPHVLFDAYGNDIQTVVGEIWQTAGLLGNYVRLCSGEYWDLGLRRDAVPFEVEVSYRTLTHFRVAAGQKEVLFTDTFVDDGDLEDAIRKLGRSHPMPDWVYRSCVEADSFTTVLRDEQLRWYLSLGYRKSQQMQLRAA